MGWFEKLMVKVFPFFDITRDENGEKEIYLRRWFIYPRNKEFKKMEPRVYLHKFYHGDEDPHPHDHPWSFTSLILKEGYWEEIPEEQDFSRRDYRNAIDFKIEYRNNRVYRLLRFKAGTVLVRPANWKHRVVLDTNEEGTAKQAWTLVKTGIKERSWGFWIGDKMCPWRNYTDGVCWCDSNESATDRPKVSFHA